MVVRNLLKVHCWNSFFIILLHMFYNGERNVYVDNLLETIFEHFFTHFRISATNVQNLEWWLDVLCDHIFYARVSLIPIERFLIFLISWGIPKSYLFGIKVIALGQKVIYFRSYLDVLDIPQDEKKNKKHIILRIPKR